MKVKNKHVGELRFDTKVNEKTNAIDVKFEGFRSRNEAEQFADWLHRGLTEWFEDMNNEVIEKYEKEKDEPTRH
jgi:hypothetical protein